MLTNLQEIKGKPIEKSRQYKSPLVREVPWCGLVPSHPDFDKDLCWWCQADLRIKTIPDVVIWCKKCYQLHYKKWNGEYMEQSTIGIGKDLMELGDKLRKGELKPKLMKIDEPSGKVVIED